MLDKLIEIAKGFCKEDIEWNEDTSILTDMALSSLEIFDFIFKVETQFKIRFTDRELRDIDTLGDLQRLTERKVNSK